MEREHFSFISAVRRRRIDIVATEPRLNTQGNKMKTSRIAVARSTTVALISGSAKEAVRLMRGASFSYEKMLAAGGVLMALGKELLSIDTVKEQCFS
ncbi:hypothetical protein [Trueperella pyogenes]|uniref:hypothetical protein n=1 Tax=Trueperella pyogenes TaxID=1661 RepID=UPI00345D0A05